MSNPKDIIGSDKVPLHLWPETATVLGAMALLDGACKYGRSNFRAVGVRASIYHDACRRHMTKWFEGEEIDPDSGLPHLAHALACIAIVIDAKAAGKLNDDRMFSGGGYTDLLNEYSEKVPRIKERYASKSPKHYTIEDSEWRYDCPPPGEFADIEVLFRNGATAQGYIEGLDWSDTGQPSDIVAWRLSK